MRVLIAKIMVFDFLWKHSSCTSNRPRDDAGNYVLVVTEFFSKL